MDIQQIITDRRTIPVVAAISGLAIGGTIGYVIGKKRTLDQLRKDIQEIRDLEEYIDDALDTDSESEFGLVIEEEDLEDIEVEEEVPQPEPENQGTIESPVIVENPSGDPDVSVIRNVFRPAGNDQWVWEDELAIRNGREYYTIHHEEFANNELDYNQATVTYYRGDNILSDEQDAPVYNYTNLMGEPRFGHGSGDENVVYIRNDKIHMEWEVILDEGHFSVEVLGLEIEEEFEAKDLQHSSDRRFRGD